MEEGKKGMPHGRAALIAAGITGVCAIVAAIIVSGHNSSAGSSPPGAPAPSTPTSASALPISSSVDDSTTPTSTTESRPSASEPVPPVSTYLSDLIDQVGHAQAGPISLKGKTYPNSVEYGYVQVGEGLGQGGSVVSFIYDINGGTYHSLDAVVGFLSYNTDPAAVGMFTVKVDNRQIKSVTCARYDVCPIHASLPSGSQLALDMRLIKWTDPNKRAYFPAAYPAWGDAALSP